MPQEMYMTLTLNFERVTTLMSGSVGFFVSPNLYNSFDTLLICFHGLMNKWQQVFSKLAFFQNCNSAEFLS